MPSTFLNLILLAGLVVQSSCVAPTLLGKFSYPHAAFSTLYQQGTSSRYDLLLSSFGIFSSNVAVVSDVGQYLQRVSSINTKTLTQNVKWPNEVTGVPPAVLKSSTRYMAIPDGFLVPGKTYGSVSLINVDGSQSSPKTITGGGNWFYHRVRWVDMDKDGRLDGLTARAHKPFIGSAQGQLLWLSNPAGHSIDSPWTENVIASGPDTFFEFSTLTAGGKSYEVILTSEFFDQKLRIFWTEDPQQNWKNTQYIRNREIDSSVHGNPFDILLSDLNGDGKQDILVTTNSASNGTVLAYEIPADFRKGSFSRSVLTSGYRPHSFGLNKGAPGAAYVIPAPQGKKPSILISGDDAAVVSLLTPSAPSDPKNWSYSRSDFLQTGSSTVGGLSLADVDGDGHLELFVPSYNEGKVYVYRL